LIALSNGDKINPVSMENVIRSHPVIQAALVIGQCQFSPSLLIEIASDHSPANDEERSAAIQEIKPRVEEENRITSGFAKISKSLILLQRPDSRSCVLEKGRHRG
jgi:long-subunit acyl-CoA synthetase (AMP-forming)